MECIYSVKTPSFSPKDVLLFVSIRPSVKIIRLRFTDTVILLFAALKKRDYFLKRYQGESLKERKRA